MGRTKRVIGMITGLCSDHEFYGAIFPCHPHGLMIVEGDCNALDLESQMFIAQGAAIISEIDDDGLPIRMYCPAIDAYDETTNYSLESARDWIKSVRKVVGYGIGYEDLDLDDDNHEKDFVMKIVTDI